LSRTGKGLLWPSFALSRGLQVCLFAQDRI
jgi:hypothetical protein